MDKKANCTCCNRVMQSNELIVFNGNKVCKDCLIKLSESGNTCPNCGTVIPADAQQVGFLLTSPNSTPKEKVAAVESLAIVCPKCHIIFFDNWQYGVVRTLLNKEESNG